MQQQVSIRYNTPRASGRFHHNFVIHSNLSYVGRFVRSRKEKEMIRWAIVHIVNESLLPRPLLVPNVVIGNSNSKPERRGESLLKNLTFVKTVVERGTLNPVGRVIVRSALEAARSWEFSGARGVKSVMALAFSMNPIRGHVIIVEVERTNLPKPFIES